MYDIEVYWLTGTSVLKSFLATGDRRKAYFASIDEAMDQLPIVSVLNAELKEG